MAGPDVPNSTILGAAAEHYVMCQLLRRGMIAALAPAGVPDADIIVSDRLGSRLSAVQVKARRDIGADGGWHMKAKHEGIVRDLLFYCFIDFGKTLVDPPRCWVIPSDVVARTVAQAHRDWLSTPGRGGHVRKDGDMRRLLPHYKDSATDPAMATGWLDQYAEAWGMIGTAQGGPPP